MENKFSTNRLQDVPETMLITLWAKAEETRKKPSNALLYDEKALEIINKIDYDFSKFKNAKFSQAGVCIRANLIDNEAQKFIQKHPDAVVVQIGSGLDARYQRIGSPKITHWYDLDLPEVIELRRHLFTENETNTFISLSLFDYKWIEIVKAHKKPVLLIIEGVLMYFDPKDVRNFFDSLCTHFEEVTVVFDMLAFSLVGNSKKHDSLGTMKGKTRPEFKWSLLNSKEMEAWNPKIHIENEYFMSDYDKGRYPFLFRILYKFSYFYKRFNQRVITLKINDKS